MSTFRIHWISDISSHKYIMQNLRYKFIILNFLIGANLHILKILKINLRKGVVHLLSSQVTRGLLIGDRFRR
jgi:hypothetical protein